MIAFVNAKINLGLQIVARREDGYHDLQTIFYPVGRFNGTPENPAPFCDILEVREGKGLSVEFRGRNIDCKPEDNLVTRAAHLFYRAAGIEPATGIVLEKHLPDGAGMGGGSADASFVLRMLRDFEKEQRGVVLDDSELLSLALKLGADCPFFIYNRPMFAGGIGEKLEDIKLDLNGYWLGVIKPDVYVSTRDAFGGIIPREPEYDLRAIARLPVEEWQGLMKNDFETTIFRKYPELQEIKDFLREQGALYASMSGSGSSIFGIFPDKESARIALENHSLSNIEAIYLLKL